MRKQVISNSGISAKKRSRRSLCAAFPVALALFFLFGCGFMGTGGDPTDCGVGTRYYTITFSGNDNTAGSPPAPIRAADFSYITLPDKGNMTKDGYTFDGWRDDNSGTKYDGGSLYKIDSRSLTLYAIWIAEVATPSTFVVEVTSAGTGSDGSGRYAVGATVIISAGTPPEGEVFTGWTSSSNGVVFADSSDAMTTFIMPGNNVTVRAVFEAESPPTPTTYAVTVTGGSGSGNYAAGATVIITAEDAPEGKVFKNWASSSNGVVFAKASDATTTFIMPGNDVTVGAVFEAIKYKLTVTGGSGSGNYAAGANVYIAVWPEAGPLDINITNWTPPPPGQVFKNWATTSPGVTFTNANSAETTFIMPGNDVTVEAVYDWSFRIAEIGGKRWMAENLNVWVENSMCYENNCAKYERLYTWTAAKTACYAGWHLPSREEWGDLAKAAGGTGDYGADGKAGKALKSTSGWLDNGNGTDDYGFSGSPDAGGSGFGGYWWTATEYNSSNAYFRFMRYDMDVVGEYTDAKSLYFSVRCVAD